MKIVNGIPCVCLKEIAFVIWRDFFLQNKKGDKVDRDSINNWSSVSS